MGRRVRRCGHGMTPRFVGWIVVVLAVAIVRLMIRRSLGSSPRSVFPVGLGCMGFSWGYGPENDDAAAIDVIHRAIDLGVDHFDTADVYGPFTNEVLVGRALAGRREGVVVATKCGLVVEDKATYQLRPRRQSGARPRELRRVAPAARHRRRSTSTTCTASTRRSPSRRRGARWRSSSPPARCAGSGSPRRPSPSSTRVPRIHPVTAVQSELSLWTRDYLADVVPWCAAHGASFVAFAPLGRGFLTGKFSRRRALRSIRLPVEAAALRPGAGRAEPGDRRAGARRGGPQGRDARAGRARVGPLPRRARPRDPGHAAAQVPRGERRRRRDRADGRRSSRSSTRSPRRPADATREARPLTRPLPRARGRGEDPSRATSGTRSGPFFSCAVRASAPAARRSGRRPRARFAKRPSW